MASTFSQNRAFELMATGEEQNVWGVHLNTIFSQLDQILGTGLGVALASTNVNLSQAQATNLVFNLTGTLTANVQVVFPVGQDGVTGAKVFAIINNQTSGAFTASVVSAAAGSVALTIPQNSALLVWCDGTSFNAIASVPTLVQTVRTQAGVSDTIAQSDWSKHVRYTNGGNVAASIAQAGAGGNFANGWWTTVTNDGGGVVTITPNTSTIGGQASLNIPIGMSVAFWSDGTNYQIARGLIDGVTLDGGTF